MKFKVGDRVKVFRVRKDAGKLELEGISPFLNKVGVIHQIIRDDLYPYKLIFEENLSDDYSFLAEELELVQ